MQCFPSGSGCHPHLQKEGSGAVAVGSLPALTVVGPAGSDPAPQALRLRPAR